MNAIRLACAIASVISAILASGSATWAQPYPVRPIRFVVTFPAGGFTDVSARIVAQYWTEQFGQPVIVENRPGGSTVIGADTVAKSKPDGYTLLYTGASTYTINPIVLKDLPYDPASAFAPVGIIGSTALLILAHPSVPARNIGELVALLSARPSQFSYGSFGTATASHFIGEFLWSTLRIKLLHVPYKGSTPLMTALVSGEVPLSVDTAVVAGPQIRVGKIKGLAVTTATRSSFLPEIPTLAEAGYRAIDIGGWVALSAPAATPEVVLRRLRDETVRLRGVKYIQEKFAALGVEVVGSTAEEFTSKVKVDLQRFAKIAKEADIRID